ncbi:hypothetical protein IEQ44_10425 [Nocardioides sp. Y6]|uniref:Terpene cyclase/mutase family protein n=1 Tax=Nocardioides malaquae TaxID=2773426 RepID=A0ABR9RU32_9ACTN|nr:hypothetical protein [Nocardioides malaquae]MBE7325074.1 hypothetical protein [Nocardioides malaquae]
MLRIARSGRLVALVASTALVLTTVQGPAHATPAQATPPADPVPAELASGWLVGNLKNGLIETASEWEGETFSGPSYGTSVDLALALDAVGGHDAAVAEITDAVAGGVETYTGSGGEVYSGSAAKALALAVSQGRDTASFGGIDLLGRVEDRVITTGASTGRLEDLSAWGDYANSIGQAFAAGALTAAGSPLADEVTDFLLAQQCDAGFFRLYFNADKDAAAQSCDAASPAVSPEQSADTTALVALQLASLAGSDPAVRSALDRAATWLVSQQQADGSFGDPQNGANSNTTGLGGWALATLGRDAQAAKAATWLRALQVVDACAPGPLKGEQGAVAYDEQGWNDGATYGISDPLDRSQWVIADVQALPALAYAPASTRAEGASLRLPRFAKAGTKVTVTVDGIAPGERACLTGLGATRQLIGSGDVLRVSVPVKAGTSRPTLLTATTKVQQAGGLTVLGKKKLKVRVAKKQVKRNARVKVTVRGLAAGERVTVKVRGKKVAQGKANRKGVFVRRVKVGKARGLAAVKVRGQYATRTGVAKVRVR